ncbi:SPL family radical SAM protein [Acidiplasma aeolicum]|uniref:Radical SAM protein n=1 Tax=Acidiplasma aeolicum TaxID=507754 RepID=A0A0Q1B5F6_9ARCH|nr:radical SAM protein [Acidiplasma aeolicum]KQB35267.1 radical SAM protein [Acidiplasma aeolicum]
MHINRKKIIINEINAKHALGISGMKELDYTLNPYLGCLHGCLYCYAIGMNPKNIAGDWGNVLYVRKNITEILQMEAKKYKKGIVGISSITDPYNPVEGKYRLTRNSIEILAKNNFYVTLQTKSPLALRDIDIIKKYRNTIDIGYTITTMDENIKEMIEPYSPSVRSRMRALKKFSENGIKTWIFIGPIIKNINDNLNDIYNIIEFASKIKSRIIYDKYVNYPGPGKYMENINYGISDSAWWNDMELKINGMCHDLNVLCTSEQADWLYERGQKTLF